MANNLNYLDVPVLLITFNRPELTKQLVQTLKEVEIKKLYVFADGPREGNSTDQIKCEAVRNIIEKKIDWDCKLFTNFQEKNLGCGYGPAKAITWFFNNVESGIILEDDIKPSSSFFKFCQVLLKRYKEQKKVMHITGLNWQDGKKRGNADYYFSYYPGIWGWATWADRWKLFDHELTGLQEFISRNKIQNVSVSKQEQEYHINSFREAKKGQDHIWDLAWVYTIFKNEGYCIWPNTTLTANVGFGNKATHTINKKDPRSNCPIYEMDFPLKHPNRIERNLEGDRHMARKIFKAKFTGDNILNFLRLLKQKVIT